MHASILKPFAAAEQEQSSPADRLHPPAGRPPAPEQTHQSSERAPAYLKDLQTGQNRIQQKLQRRSELPRPRPNISGSDSTGRARPELRRRKDAHEHGHMHSTTIYPKAIRVFWRRHSRVARGRGTHRHSRRRTRYQFQTSVTLTLTPTVPSRPVPFEPTSRPAVSNHSPSRPARPAAANSDARAHACATSGPRSDRPRPRLAPCVRRARAGPVELRAPSRACRRPGQARPLSLAG